MKGLITDRTQQNVSRRNTLAAKGWYGMTPEEQAEWSGNPLNTMGVNLLPYGPNYSSSVEVKYRNGEIIAITNTAGIYLYAISIIGNATDYENKTFTLSADYIESVGGGSPQLALYWHDDNGFDFAGASISTADSVTFTISPNVNGRAYLAMYVYVTTAEEVAAGAGVRFVGVMFENGDTRHSYVPYVEVIPTMATKGAYNYSDLNRVERAVSEISDLVGLNLTTKTDWRMWDIPKSADMVRYLNNISMIRNFITDKSGVPETPTTMNHLTYADANDIEKILLAAYESVTASL